MPQGAATQIGFLVIFIVIMYLLLIRPQRKKEKAINEMRASVQVGDEIVTIGGICGKVVKTKDESLVIQVGADKIKFEIMRWGVSRISESYGRTSKRSRPVDEEDEDTDDKKALPKKMKKVRVEEPEEKETADVEADADIDEADAKK